LARSARSASIGSAVSSISSATPVPQVFTSRTIPPSPWWYPRRALVMRCSPRVSPPSPVATLSRTHRGVDSWMIGGMKVLRSAPAQKASPAPVWIATSTESSSRKQLRHPARPLY